MYALKTENSDNVLPNFLNYADRFNLSTQHLLNTNRDVSKKACHKMCDNLWWSEIVKSPKAASYILFKNDVCMEDYLYIVKNSKERNALIRFRLSNHDLMIEKGRHFRPKIEKSKRYCHFCKDKVENEVHFLTECPVYDEERKLLYETCRIYNRSGLIFDLIPTKEQIFTFILSSKNPNIINSLAKFLHNSFKIRDNMLQLKL